MIKYSEIEHLPLDHPLMLQFMKQERDLEVYKETSRDCGMDEESMEYFNRYVAGDK
jgi:hypothetical protein